MRVPLSHTSSGNTRLLTVELGQETELPLLGGIWESDLLTPKAKL